MWAVFFSTGGLEIVEGAVNKKDFLVDLNEVKEKPTQLGLYKQQQRRSNSWHMLNVHMLVDGLIVGWTGESEKIMRNQAESVIRETCLSHPLTIGSVLRRIPGTRRANVSKYAS